MVERSRLKFRASGLCRWSRKAAFRPGADIEDLTYKLNASCDDRKIPFHCPASSRFLSLLVGVCICATNLVPCGASPRIMWGRTFFPTSLGQLSLVCNRRRSYNRMATKHSATGVERLAGSWKFRNHNFSTTRCAAFTSLYWRKHRGTARLHTTITSPVAPFTGWSKR